MSSPSSVLSAQVLEALKAVQDPDLHRDIVSLGFVQNMECDVASGRVAFHVVLTTPACPAKEKLEAEARQAALSVAGVKEVNITMRADVPSSTQKAVSGVKAASQSIPGVRQIIAVSSGKGGVGKSTVATNLAVSLALEGARVGILDADLHGPNLPTMFGLTETPELQKDDQGNEFLVPPSAHGVQVMSMGFLIPADQPLIWRGPMLHSALQQLCFQTRWDNVDYLILDLPPGTGDVQLSLAQMIPLSGTVLVTTPQEVALQDVRRAVSMWEKVRVPVFGVVENMSYLRTQNGDTQYIFGKDGGKLLAERMHTDLLGQVPLEMDVRLGGDEGRPIVLRAPGSEAAIVFRAMARLVAQKVSIASAQASLQESKIQIGKF